MTKFLAIDGEAVNNKYALLAASDGTHVLNVDELTTKECFDYLISKRESGRVIVCFGLNYDVNMWLGCLNRNTLIELWNTGECIYRVRDDVYKIEWIPAHWIKITKLHHKPVWVYEVWGFFQSSFVNSLRNWGFEPPPDMESMKAQRGEFTQDELDKIISYCKSECKNTVQLMNSLESACQIAKIVPRQWMGAGSLAGALLSSRKWVKAHHVHDYELGPDECKDAILRAYFGGRVEMFKQGVYDWVTTADIRSAYPHAIRQLPSLRNGKLTHVTEYSSRISHGIWHVKWDNIPSKVTGNMKILMPFPVRYHKDVYYPTSGVGWYHACEVQAVIAMGYPIEVIEGWCLTNQDGTYPFLWVKDVYELRNKWKSEGLAAEKVLKLSLNSMYGKLAQGIGYKQSEFTFKGREEPLPKWQSYFWAGEITARTRAKMLEAAVASDTPLMLATDGLFCEASKLKDNPRLGGWEVTEYQSLFIARPGVYRAVSEDGKEVTKSRGFASREIDYSELQSEYESDGVQGIYRYDSKRFIGLGTALMRKDFSVWKTWEEKERKVTFMPAGKDVDLSQDSFTPFSEELPESEPYKPKTRGMIEESQVNQTEQPMVTI